MAAQEFDQMLEKYADVIVKVGLNLQPRQRLVIRTDVRDAMLARQVTESAYKAGARFVDIVYLDSQVDRAKVKYADEANLADGFGWQANALLEYLDKGDALLFIVAIDPGLLQGLDSARISNHIRAEHEAFKSVMLHWRKLTINRCVVIGTNPNWAAKVLPNVPTNQVEERIWETIFKLCRIDQPDPLAAWETHIENLAARCKYMNEKSYLALAYKSQNTDLKIGLPKNHIWSSARTRAGNGIENTVNIPTEEIFTIPHKDQTEGMVTLTRPINLDGNLVEGVTYTFEKGRVIKMTATKGESNLREMLEVDATANCLGEVALVPHSSPISQSGLIFYNILYDENASSHIALGAAYRISLKNGREMPDEEFKKHGGNISSLHLDCMIGSADMDIDGVKEDGAREPVMRQGEWAFDV